MTMVVLGKKEYIDSSFWRICSKLCELFLAWSITIFVVLKSIGFLGLISLWEFIKLYILQERICSITLWVVSCVICHYICCLEVRWASRFDQSFGTYGCQKPFCRDCGGQPSNSLSKRVSHCCFLLFWSNCSPRSLSMLVTHPGERSF